MSEGEKIYTTKYRNVQRFFHTSKHVSRFGGIASLLAYDIDTFFKTNLLASRVFTRLLSATTKQCQPKHNAHTANTHTHKKGIQQPEIIHF